MCEALAIALAIALPFSAGLIGEAWVRVAKVQKQERDA